MKLTITWDPETQAADLEFDSKDFKSWAFVRAVLHQAGIVAEHKHVAMMRQQQAAAMQREMQKEAVRNLIRG